MIDKPYFNFDFPQILAVGGYNDKMRAEKCPVCGKPFRHTPEHVYRIGKRRFVCSWTCQRKIEREEEAKRAARSAEKEHDEEDNP